MSTADRLLAALDDLVRQIDASMRAGEIAAAITTASRVTPLINRITSGRGEFESAEATRRLNAIRTRFAELDQWIEARLLQIRNELKATGATARRVAAIAPVYGAPQRPAPTLNARG